MEKRKHSASPGAGDEKRRLWARFVSSGRIEDYLKYSRFGRGEADKED